MLELATPRRLSRSAATSTAMARCESVDTAPSFRAWTVSARTRCTWPMAVVSAVSVASSQLCPSVVFLANCWTALWSCRICSALLAPVGESDGTLISFPEGNCCCSFATGDRLVFRPRSAVWVTARCVMRIRSPPHEAGAVDQRVQCLVDGGHHAGGRAVGVLEGQHVGHLLVEVDAGHGLAGGVHLGGDHLLHLGVPGGDRGLHAEGDDERPVGGVHAAVLEAQVEEGVGVAAVRRGLPEDAGSGLRRGDELG